MSTEEIDFLDSLQGDPAPAPKVVPAVVTPAAPSPWKGRLELAAIVALTFVVAVLGTALWLGPRGDSPAPSGEYDPRFVPIGRAYLEDLGVAYGSSLEDGAKILDAGQSIGVAGDTAATAWEKNRKSAFNARVTPELSKVVEQGKPDKEVTSADRTALAKAYRGLAKGVSGK